MTEEEHPLPALVDVGAILCKKSSKHMAVDLDRMFQHWPELKAKCWQVNFEGRGGHRKTWVPNTVAALIEFIFLLPGAAAAELRKAAAESFARLYGEDLRLIGQLEHLAHVQEALRGEGSLVPASAEVSRQVPTRTLVARTACVVARRSVALAVRKSHLKFKNELKALEERQAIRFQTVLSEQRQFLLAEITLRMGQRLVDIRDYILNAVSTPTGLFVQAIRGAVRQPSRRSTIDAGRYPQDQLASSDTLAGCVCLHTVLKQVLGKPYTTPVGVELPGVVLTHGAWKKLRNLVGKRALQFRLQQHALGLCQWPRLWSFGGPRDNSGPRYVFLLEEATACIQDILGQMYTDSVSVAAHIRQVIQTTPAGVWPLHDTEVEPDWSSISEESDRADQAAGGQ
jgi:hypothetical protein